MSQKFEIRPIAYDSHEYGLTIRLRAKILREPLGLRFTAEELARDRDAIHLGAFAGMDLLGCLILSPRSDSVVQMRQVAVAAGSQGKGVGRALVSFSENAARAKGFTLLELNAREIAGPFYSRMGYEAYGEPFTEVTVLHRKMRKRL